MPTAFASHDELEPDGEALRMRPAPLLRTLDQELVRPQHLARGTHATVADTPELGVLSRAAGLIADQQVRNRGTIGGSLAHGDPASDLPGVLLATEGEVRAQGPNGERTIPAGEMFQDYLTTALAPD